MTVNVFGSKLNTEPHETYAHGGLTVLEWLTRENDEFDVDKPPQIGVSLNGNRLTPEDWCTAYFEISDVVDIVLEPKGTELFFGALFLVAIQTMTPKIPKVSSQSQSGDSINQASIKGNKVKLNSTIREGAGKNKIFPDYVLPPRRWFASPREQRVEMLLSVGKGKYDCPSNKVLIGDTPAISLGSDVTFQFYQPGADVSGNTASLWWNDVTEVGSSSNGSSGLELTNSTNITPGFVASSIQFSDYTVTVPSGAGAFPSDWSAGLIVRIISPYSYDFVDGLSGARDIVRGNNLNMLNPTVGSVIEISGVNAGIYVVNSFTPSTGSTPAEMTLNFQNGQPVTSLTLGTISTTIGPSGLRYRVTVFSTAQITVDRLTSSGATDSAFPGFIFNQSAAGSVSLDPSSLVGGYRGPFAACPAGDKVTAIEWDVFYPSGLIGIGAKGDFYTIPSNHFFEWRDMDVAGAWTVVQKSVSASSRDAVGYTFRVDLPYAMRAEARIRRGPTVSQEWQDSSVWYGFRGLLKSPARYVGLTLMALNARGGDRLSAQSESLVSVEATRILPVRRNGVWLPEQATRDIAPWVLYTLRDIGYGDAEVDLPEMDRLDAIWRSRGDTFDQAIIEGSTAQTVINNALAAGFSELTAERGLLRPVRDEPRVGYEATYSPQEYLEGGGLNREFTLIRPDDYDGVDVEYMDGVIWQVATVRCRLPGDVGRRVQKITAEGISTRTKAYQLGMRQRRALKYRRWTYTFSTELAALNSRYLSYVQLADDVPSYAQSAIMIDYADQVVEASEAFDWSTPGPHYLYVRRADGSNSGPYVATRVDDFRLRIAQPLDFVPVLDLSIEPPHLLFGEGYAVLVTDISPNGDSEVRVEAETYDVRVYADDNSLPPADA